MENDQNMQLIAAYLEGELTPDEQIQLEKRLATDPDFKADFDLYRDADSLLSESASLSLKEKMQAFEKEEGGSIRRMYGFRIAAVAAVLLVLIASFFWYNSSPDLGPKELATAYFDPYPAGNLRGGAKMEHPFNQGMSAYIQQDYSSAILALREIPSDQASFIESQLYLGNAYLAQKQYTEAITPLLNVSHSLDSRFAEAADWYLLLAFLGAENQEGFDTLSNRILASPSHAYKIKVEELER